jgi:serine/threonine-protein kinase RsbT
VTEEKKLHHEPSLSMEFKINEKDFLMAGESASKTKRVLQQLGLPQEVVKNAAIIVYEAAMNVVIHATSGILKVLIVPEEVQIITDDVGAGIPDIDLAMQEGYSTAGREIQEMGFGAGMGLPNIKLCSSEMKIKSEVGVGTVLEAKIYLKRKNGSV